MMKVTNFLMFTYELYIILESKMCLSDEIRTMFGPDSGDSPDWRQQIESTEQMASSTNLYAVSFQHFIDKLVISPFENAIFKLQ